MTESQRTDTSSDGGRKSPGRRPRQRRRVGVGAVLRTAAQTFRRHASRILVLALVVALVITVAEVVSDNVVDPHNTALSLGGTLSVEAISLLGTILLAGFLCKIVGEDEHGGGDAPSHEHVTIIVVLRTLPWISLVLADILLTILTLAGLLLLVIPGLIMLTLFALVAPAIEIERRSALSGLRRSAHLVRRHFWTVALLVALPQIGLAVAESVLPSPHGAVHILEVIVVRVLALAPLEAAITLILVALCYRLIDLDAPPATPPAGSASASG